MGDNIINGGWKMTGGGGWGSKSSFDGVFSGFLFPLIFYFSSKNT